ncbi:hypothetical protein MIMGU_mgv1a003280mg [Erythranthe guttata]|uniref:PWI domain-containing protein n=1 Tax=Erythranthe guttata TaxID=4155 RepID=A0A022QRA6_ERYGU|nr:hypothetical protein MIMGU_mgv1a003280mg [Erythranthe guttata]
MQLNVNQATREYLERYVEKKSESLKSIKESETEGAEKETVSASDAETDDIFKSSEESPKPSSDEHKRDENEMNKEKPDAASFGLVTDEDRKADREALDKLAGMIEERLKSKPLPPPPPPPQRPVDGPGNSNSEQPSESRDRESEEDLAKNDSEEKNEDEKTAESKPSSQHDRTETNSPDRSRRHDRNKDRETNREKERELEKYEREREQERAKREKDREHRSREDERRFKAHEKEWEAREKEREHWQKREREREKERAQERKWEIMDQERDGDDGYGKKRKYKTSDEDRRRRQREKEEDQADRLREEEEIAEAKMRAKEEQKKQLEALKIIADQPANGHEKAILLNETNTVNQVNVDMFDHEPSHETYEGEGVSQNGISDEFVVSSNSASDAQQNSNLPARKLGFGLSGSGKRTAVPSVFKEDEDEDAHKEKKMRPLVPIDYTEEQQVVQSSTSEDPSANMVAAAEFVKRISTANPKEEKSDVEKEKNRRSHERSILLLWSSAKKSYLRTLQNALHERMRPWVSKKITEFLGEEEVSLVDYIVTSIQDHVDAGEMLERLQSILDDEAEMFVLKMWRMLIFEIKKVENGILKSK